MKVDDLELQRRLGVVGRDPRWAVAWKFPPTTAVTRLHRVHWNVGKFGDLHPFGELEPVHVGGVTVKLATLHNEEDLARKDVRSGDDVIVLRAGDVIPQVVSPGAARGRAARTARRPSGRRRAARRATRRRSRTRAACSPAAPTATARTAAGSCSSTTPAALDIDGLGEKQVAHAAGRRPRRARSPTTTGSAKEQLLELEGVGEVSAENLLRSIEASRERPFGSVLFAIGIEGVGVVTGRNLAQHFRSIDALLAATPEDDRRDAGDRPGGGGAHPRPARRPADARADRRPAREGPAGGRGRAARRGRR